MARNSWNLPLNRLFKLSTTTWFVFLFFTSLAEANSGITYHGRILKPSGSAVNSSTVQFRIQVRTPGSENCLLWEEQQTKDLSATGGVFTITINDTAEPTLLANTLPYTIERIFSNRTPYAALTNCSSGTSYTPSSQVDGRNLQVFFREAPTDPWEQMPPTKINYVPLALNSVQLQGYQATDFLKIDPLAIYTPLTAANVNTLVDLIAGTNTQYLRPSSIFAGDVTGTAGVTVVEKIRGTNVVATAPTLNQILKFNGTNWVPSADDTGAAPADASYTVKGIVQINTDLATSGLFIAGGALSLPNVITAGGPTGSAQTVPVITYDQKGRLTAVSTATINDTTKLPLAGGTMSGSINMGGQNITNAVSVAATNFSGRNLILNDNDTNTVTVRTPADILANYALTLPPTSGTSGYVLATDGTGVLSWVNPSAGSVTNVTSANAYITVGTGSTTPLITAVVGTAANTLAAGDDARILGALQTLDYNADIAGIIGVNVCTADEKPYWNTVLGTWDCVVIGTVANATTAVNFTGSLAGDVSGTQGATSVDKIKGIAVSAATLNNQIMIYNGTAWVNSVVSGDATLANTGALTLASTVVAGGVGSASAVPTINYDAKGRITSTSSAAYQDATGAVKGIVQVGSNLTIAAGTISLTNADALAALGFTPLNKAGDTMTGNLGLNAVAADPAGLVLADKGKVWYNTTSNQVKYWDGAAVQALGISGAGLTSLGGQSGSTQTFANAATGTAPAFSSAANVHTLNIPLASGAGVTSGTIAKTDYDSFVAKLTSPLTTKGDILTRDATTHVRLPVGTDGQVLSANSVAAGGLSWITPQNGDITDVVAGAGLTGGAASGSATVDVIAGTGIVVNANDVAVDVGTTVGKIVQVQALGKLPILDGSDLINLDAGDITAGTLPIIRGGTGLATSGTANQVLGVNAGATGLEYKTITAGTGVTITNAANAVTINATGSGGTVTSVGVSVPAYMTSTGGPVTTTGTIALGFGSQAAKSVFAAPQGAAGAPSFRNLNIADVQSSVAGSFLTGAGCTAGQALTYISASDTIACSTIIPTVANTSTLANTRIWVGDVGNKAQEVLVSGDATLASTGALTLASTVTAGAAGSASAVPTINYDAKGRITSTSSTAYQDATAGAKGVVSVGTNLTVTAGAISLTNANALAAIGYTPLNKAGDNMSGTLGLFQTAADPSTAGWNATQKGYSWFNTTSNSVKYWDGSAIQALGVSGAGLTSLGGQSGSTQTFASGTTGTTPAFSSAANVHTLNIPLASGAGVTSGTIAKADYDSFVAKLTSPLTTKGDILTRDATTHVRLPVGTDGQVLSANSVAAGGLSWITPQNGDITDVVAGAGLTGGAASGSATVDVIAGTGIVVNANDVAVDVGTTVGKIVQVQALGKLPILDGSDLINLDAGDITAGTLPIIRGGTGLATSGTANQVLGVNAGATGLEYKTITAGTGVTITNAANAVTINATGSGGTVTSVGVSVPAYMTSTGGPVTTTGTIAVGFGSQAAKSVFAAPQGAAGAPSFRNLNIADVQSSVAGSFLTGAGCTAGQALTYISASDTIACSTIIPTVANTSTLANTRIWVGDVGNKAQEVLVSGDATLASTGALTLASTVTAGAAGSASAVPTINYDAKGRITSTSSAAYQDATAALKGVVSVGTNLTVTAGAISLTNANALAAIGYTPLNKAGDTMTGNLGLNAVAADPAGLVLADKGKVWYNTTSNQVKYWDGAAAVALGVSGAGLTSLGGQSGSTQTFAVNASGTAPALTSATNTHTLSIPLASGAGVTSGTIAKADYDSFVAKLGTASTFAGDVSGTSSTMSVDKIKGKTVSAPTLANQIMIYDGTNWVNNIMSGDATMLSTGALTLKNTGTAGTFKSVTTDAQGRVTAGTNPTTLSGFGITDAVQNAGGTPSVTTGTEATRPVAGTAGRIYLSSDTFRMFRDNGVSWDQLNVNASDLSSGTVAVARGGTGVGTVPTNGQLLIGNGTGYAVGNLTAGTGVSITNSAGGVTINATGSGGTVTSVGVSVPAYMTSTGGPVTTTGTIALGFGSQAAKSVFAAPQGVAGAPSFRNLNIADVQSSVAGSFLTGAGCTAGQALTYISASDTIACSTIVPTVANTSTLANTRIWVGDVGNKAQEVLVSGDATLANTGALTLASTVTAGAAGSASAVPTINYDAKGRITSTSSAAYQDATAALKGVVSVGTNLTVTAGAISLTNANALAAIGYTPLNKAGDTMTGNLGLNAVAADPVGLVLADKGKVWFNTTSNQVKYWDGAAVQALGISGAGLTSLGSQTGSTQTFAVNASGTAPALTSATNTHTLSIPLASGAGVTSGTIAKADYDSFVAKLTSPLTTKGDILTRDATTHVRLPVGTDGQVLSANSVAAGGLSWITPQNGDITDVVAGAGLTGGAATGSATVDVAAGTGIIVNANDVAVDVGTTVGKIVQVQALGKLPILDGSDLTNLDAGDITAGTLPIIRGGTNSAAALTNGKVMVSTAGSIVEGMASATAKTANTFVMRDGTGGVTGALGTFDQLALNGSVAGTLNVLVPSSFTTWSMTLPANAGTAGQVLSTNGTGVTSWIAALTATTGFMNGGNSFGAAATLGTDDAFGLNFETGGTTKMSILSGGNVGVGTIAPSSPLSVTPLQYNTGTASQSLTTITGVGTIWTTALIGSQFVFANGVTAGTITAVGSATSLTVTASQTVASQAYAVGYTGLQVASTGNVGIGTAAPNAPLQVNVIGAGVALRVGDAAAGAFTDFSRNSLNAIGSGYTINSAAGSVSLQTASVDRIFINNAGNVGIGTAAPGAKLEVAGQVKITGGVPGLGKVLTSDATGLATWETPAAGGITTLNTLTALSQSFATGVAGTAPAFASAVSTHTLNIPLASGAGVTSGTISKTDYDKFNSGTTISGTSGGIPYYNSATTQASSGLLATNGVLLGGGAGAAPTSTAAGAANMVLRIPAGGGAPVFGTIDLATAVTGILPIANGGTNSAAALTNGKVMVSTAGAVVEGMASATAKTINTFVMRDGTGGVTGALGTFDQLALNGSVAGTLNVLVPSSFTTWSMTLPANAGTAGQVLSTNGAGVTSWATALTATTGFMNGGNTFGAAATLGTNDAFDLNIETGGTTKMTVLNNGNVGIGTSTPGGKLSIRGGEAADESRLTFQATDNSNRFIMETDLDITTANDLLGFRSVSVDNILVLKGNGGVGIGTNSPSGRLSVTPLQYSAGTASQALTTVTGAATAWTAAMVGSQFVFADGVSAGTITAVGSATSLTVSTSQTVASQLYSLSYTGLQVNNLGNVGIGTTTPGAKLAVSGNTILGGNTAATGAAATDTTILGDTFFGTSGSWKVTAGGTGSLGYLSVNAPSSAGASIDAITPNATTIGLRIKASPAQTAEILQVQNSAAAIIAQITGTGGAYFAGDVGIGVPSPTAKLDVSGNLRVIAGQAYVAIQTPATSATITIDANAGNSTVWDAGVAANPTVVVNNMKAGGSYLVVVQGTGTGFVGFTCNSGNGVGALPTGFMPANGSRTAGTLNKTMYNLISDGTNCLITWVSGF